jgi:WD40 repeat protein
MDWHPSGDYITMIHRYDILNLTWDDFERTYFEFFNGYIDTLAWSPIGDYLIANNQHAPAIYLWKRSNSEQRVFEQIPVALSGDGIESGGVSWSPTGDTIIAYTGEYGYERRDFIDVDSGERIRNISRVWAMTRGTFGEDASPVWNADYTRYALFDWRSNDIIVAGFDDEPETVIWNSEQARYVIGDDSDEGKLLPEIKYPIALENFLGMNWQDGMLQITVGEDWSSAEYYLMSLETGELSETVTPQRPVVIADWEQHDVFDDSGAGTVDYDLTIRHPITGETLATYTEAEHPYTPILEGGGSISASAVNPGQTFIAVAVKGGVAFYSLEDGMLLYAVHTESDIASLDWDPAGEILAAGSMDGTVHLFGVALR